MKTSTYSRPGSTLGILAGSGPLPARIVQVCRDSGREYFVVAFKDQADKGAFGDDPHVWVRLGAVGKAIEHLRDAGCQELVMAGVVRRPSFAALRPDRWLTGFFAKSGAQTLGDGNLLKTLIRTLEDSEGFRIVGADSLLPDLLAEKGVYGRVKPDRQADDDIQCGIDAARDIGRRADDAAPFSGLAFKIMNDPFMGTLTFTRIYSGQLKKGDQILNATKGKRERVGRMVMMHANKQQEITEAFAGDIIALAGLKDTTTGDTLCDISKPVVLETMTFPQPVIEIAVEPKTKADQEKMSRGLARLAAEDPSFAVETDQESGQTIMKGMGELHLDILIDRLRREFNVEANIGTPQVAYRETVSREAVIDYTHKKHSGGSGQFARIKLVIAPTAVGEGYAFESKVVGGSVPKEYIPGVEKGIRSVMDSGPLAGFPVIDFKVSLIDGASHDVDSSVLAFEIAARAAMREGLKKAGVKLLEPIMKVEVVTPEEYTGGIIGDLTSRRGQMRSQEARGNAVVINAFVPLANMFGYISTLRSMSSGRAQFTMQFDHYDRVPSNISEEIQAKYA